MSRAIAGGFLGGSTEKTRTNEATGTLVFSQGSSPPANRHSNLASLRPRIEPMSTDGYQDIR
eukprot:3164510-Rhodomonas_salina.1